MEPASSRVPGVQPCRSVDRVRRAWTTHGDLTGFLVDDLATQKEALVADADGTVLALLRRRHSRGGDKVVHLGAVFAAEAAMPSLARLNCHEIDIIGRLALVPGNDSIRPAC